MLRCDYAVKYKGKRPPTCAGGEGCRDCWRIYAQRLEQRLGSPHPDPGETLPASMSGDTEQPGLPGMDIPGPTLWIEPVTGAPMVTALEIVRWGQWKKSGRRVTLPSLQTHLIARKLSELGIEPPGRSVIAKWVDTAGSASAVLYALETEVQGSGALEAADEPIRYLWGVVRNIEPWPGDGDLDWKWEWSGEQLERSGIALKGNPVVRDGSEAEFQRWHAEELGRYLN